MSSAVEAAEAWIGRVSGPLASAGARLRVELPERDPVSIGSPPAAAVVRFIGEPALRALVAGDHLKLAEAYLDGEVQVEGDLREVLYVTDHLDVAPARGHMLRFWLRLWLDRRRFQRGTVAFHYDHAPDFFLPWLGKHRCYTHGFYASPEETLEVAHERKLGFACDALDLGPGSRVLDVGCGWGTFLEFAAERGIPVDGVTLSQAQADFVGARLASRDLRATVRVIDFADFRPEAPYDAVVFMGSLEHMPDYRHVSRFLSRHLAPGGRVYADFVSSPEGRLAGKFLRRYVFPGASSYVDVAALRKALGRAGLEIERLVDDSASCAFTVRDWALELEKERGALEARFGERAVRIFLLYLWGSYHFLENGRTTAWHLVATHSRS